MPTFFISSDRLVRGKGKVDPVHAMKAYRGSRGIALLVPNLTVDGGEW
jgi:hypothetical protein